jgi:Flp pilus assembly protein TadD
MKKRGQRKMTSLLTKSALGFMLLIGLAACSNPIQQIEVSTKPVAKPTLTLPSVDELNMREVKWVVINEDNIETIIADFKKRGKPFAVYALTGDGYGNLGLNFSDIRALVQQQQAIIAAYEGYYEQAEETLDKAVTID